jgi:hypothetical protein
MPRGVPGSGPNGKRGGRRKQKIEGVTYFGGEAKLVLTAEKSLGHLKVVDLGNRWAVVAT